MEISTLTIPNVLDDLNNRFYDIPFDNSAFQTTNFVLNASLTPERAYRSAGLRLHSRLEALREASFGRRKDDIKIKKLQRSIELEEDELEKELLEIEIEEIQSHRQYADKLINDAIVESQQLYDFIVSCPKYTREDFEGAERTHYEKRLLEDVRGVTGAVKSLSDMGVDLNSINTPILQYKENKDELLLR